MSLLTSFTRHSRWLCIASCAVVWAISGGAREVRAQFSIDNLEVHLRPTAGGALTAVIPVRSLTDSVQQVQIGMRDWSRDSLGANSFIDYGSGLGSCQGKLEVFPLSLQLGPRATEFIRVTYMASAAEEIGCWAGVSAIPVKPPSTVDAERFVTLEVVTIVKVYVHAPGAVGEGEMVSADVEQVLVPDSLGGPDSLLVRQVAIRFANTGQAHLRVKSTLEIRDLTSRLIATVEGSEAYLTPQAFRDILIRVPSLARGRYVAVVLLDYGAEEITAAQVEFEIP